LPNFGGGGGQGPGTKALLDQLDAELSKFQQQRGQNPIQDFLCGDSPEESLKAFAEAVDDTGKAAEAVKPIVATGATAAGAARSLSSPLATSFLGTEVANVLSNIGHLGKGAAAFGIAIDLVKGNVQAAIYDSADY
jgi:hypothetical protein